MTPNHPPRVESLAVTGPATRKPGRYEIRVRGPIGPTLLEAFPTLSTRRAGSDTILAGAFPDQSALYGAINQLGSLGLELVELRNLGTEQTSRPGAEVDEEQGETSHDH